MPGFSTDAAACWGILVPRLIELGYSPTLRYCGHLAADGGLWYCTLKKKGCLMHSLCGLSGLGERPELAIVNAALQIEVTA